MNKQKQLEERIAELEKELSNLKSQLLALAMRPPMVYQYLYQPVYPYVPQPLQPPNYPIITCTTPNSGNYTIQSGHQQWQ